jgi:alpha-beta hydrolase superfamily lysophospholipase
MRSVSGLSMHIHSWEPDQISAQLVLFHGYAEHAERYLPFVEALTASGIRVVAPDHVGHGRSEGTRGYIPKIEIAVDDACALVERTKKEYPDLPLFVFGHSMGGAIAVMVTARLQAHVQALVLSAPSLHIANTPKFLQAIAPLPAALFPKIPFMPLKGSDISRDPSIADTYKSDPLNYVGKVRFGMGWQAIRAGRLALAVASSIQLPVWVGHGTEDPLTGISGAEEFVATVASSDVHFRKVPGARHEILNEIEGPQLISEILDWIQRHR